MGKVYNRDGVRYAMRPLFDKGAKISYYQSLNRLKGVTGMSKDEMIDELGIKGWFRFSNHGKTFVIKEENINDEEDNIENLLLELDMKLDLVTCLFEKLFRYFAVEKYSFDACKNRAKKILDEVVRGESYQLKTTIDFDKPIEKNEKETLKKEIYECLYKYLKTKECSSDKYCEERAKEIIDSLR